MSNSQGELRNTALAFSPLWRNFQECSAFLKSPFCFKTHVSFHNGQDFKQQWERMLFEGSRFTPIWQTYYRKNILLNIELLTSVKDSKRLMSWAAQKTKHLEENLLADFLFFRLGHFYRLQDWENTKNSKKTRKKIKSWEKWCAQRFPVFCSTMSRHHARVGSRKYRQRRPPW